MAVSDYINKKVDLSAYSGGILYDRRIETVPDLARPGEGGELCTGIRKLMQRFAIHLFTIQGSVLHEPSRGCSFLPLVMSGSLRTRADVQLAFAESRAVIRRYMAQEESTDDPDDEKLYNAELTNVEFTDNGQIIIDVQIESQAREVTTYIIPISATVA